MNSNQINVENGLIMGILVSAAAVLINRVLQSDEDRNAVTSTVSKVITNIVKR